MEMNANHYSGFYTVLGIDVGSVSVGMVVLDAQKQVTQCLYEFHHGDISKTVRAMLEKIDLSDIGAVAATDQTPDIIQADFRCDDRVAVIAAARHFNEKVGSVLHVGGEKFAMLFFDEKGEYAGLKTSTSCAAGTGSFLDQQAGRLNLSGIAELAEIAAENTGKIPGIASRCAVFAKTDLIHVQQEGYSLPEICDGLCHGLATNIANTVFRHEKPNMPVVFCGGVAKNRAVAAHISDMLGTRPVVDDMAHLYGAFGVASRMIDKTGFSNRDVAGEKTILGVFEARRNYGYPGLALVKSGYPVFDSEDAYEYHAARGGFSNTVEIDIYSDLELKNRCSVYLGIDIGSTSTKAVWMTPQRDVLAGFYTRTAGKPVEAMCSLFEAMDDLAGRRFLNLEIKGAATTGSGRKFTGRLSGADLVLDEITAHARAAFELDSDVDTIIEIGGQDSKFTTLKNGSVTFSIMNTVCAAGTGSFLQEQAEKLGVELSAYAARTEGVRSPIASDRCTVFMERDINYYLGRGYSVDEVLAAALHSVCENYLNKVAVESSIGTTVCFQGATAKNRSLVAAFEQRLDRPVHVSRYCHLTGALGAALQLADTSAGQSTFRGLDLYTQDIPVRSEVCDLCTNHCKITVADMKDGPVAYGFLCGRDYETRRFVDNNTSGFDLARSYRRIFPVQNRVKKTAITVGIPDALYLYEDVSMWVDFFNRLGIRTITGSTGDRDVLKTGKERTGAEFCAPIAAMHGHVANLAGMADFIFLPYYLDNRENRKNREKDGGARRQYCYYSQYVPALVAGMDDAVAGKIISPVIKYLYSNVHLRMEIYRAARKIDASLNFIEIFRAFERARGRHQEAVTQWRETYETHFKAATGICVMLLGRPYTVLDPAMNKKIPYIFSTMGIKTFFQDMIDHGKEDASSIAPFLDELHWNYAASIMQAAEVVSKTPGIYPVLMTSFNCSPDSFIRDVFQNLMQCAGKPYLILETDEHGSSVGYETRIEAAVRTFRTHAVADKQHKTTATGINPVKAGEMRDKVVIFPNWDPITCRLLVANLQREGIDVQLINETEEKIKRSMRLNSGQCIPINAIAQEFVEHLRENNICPEKAALWMTHSEIACNLRLYPYKLKQMISSFGTDMEKAGVYTGDFAFTDVSVKAGTNTYFAFMFGGMLRKMGCRTRPYEKNPGETDRAIELSLEIMEDAFLGKSDMEAAAIKTVELFSQIETNSEKRPEVAIFGDLYVRDNPVFNQNLIAFIEDHGCEAITTPYTDYVKMIAPAYFKKWFTEGRYLNVLANRTLLATMVYREKTYYRHFRKILKEPEPAYDVPPAEILSSFNLIPENTGESMDNILKIYYLKKYHPDISLFVQASPAFCCPSMVTEAMAKTIEDRIGTPVVSITYDGTGGDKNRKIIPYLTFANDRQESSGGATAGI